jgi:ATP-dependent RNA helicase DHX29
MITIATPDVLQSEAYISTVALYLIFGHSPKEEKVHLRLPPQWRDLWMEMSLFEREQNDAADRGTLRQLRNMIETCKPVAELPTLPEQNNAKQRSQRDQSDTREKSETRLIIGTVSTENMAQLWLSKSSSSRYREMLKSRVKLPIWNFKDQLLRAIEENQVVIVCGETGCGKSTQVCTSLSHAIIVSRMAK